MVQVAGRLAAACDVAIATEGSSFGLPEALFGLVPGLIAPYLLERITPHAMRLWAMECKNRAASDALAAGLIDEIVVADGLAQVAAAWAWKLSRL